MNDIEISETLDKVVHSMGFGISKNYHGWYFLENCRKSRFADKSRPIELLLARIFFDTKKDLFEIFLKSEFVNVPSKYKNYDCMIYDYELERNPFYGLSFYEAAIKADLENNE